MSNTEVIILAQGSQKRLGMASGYKQLLPLPACGDMPIMERTLWQINAFPDGACRGTTVVAPEDMRPPLKHVLGESAVPEMNKWVTLPDPGNSSLKGIHRYLERRGPNHNSSRTIVLLGDVVYSWHCLNEIFSLSRTYGFVGTSNLSAGRGELWGVSWSLGWESQMMLSLTDALLRHPPFEEEYQPGQMRRWISGIKRGPLADHVRGLRRTGHYLEVDDYTRDIDLPEHLALLPKLSESAAADDHVNTPLENP